MARKAKTSGGKAEATGANYEVLAGAWYCARALFGSAAQPLFDLPADTRIVSVRCQTFEPVDDVNAETSAGGMIYVQAKRKVQLSHAEDSPLAAALDQFVQQFKLGHSTTTKSPLHAPRDRLVMATPSTSSGKIVDILPRLLRGLRDRDDLTSLKDVETNEAEHDVADVVEGHLTQSWTSHYGRPATPAELGQLLRLIWVHVLQ